LAIQEVVTCACA